MEVILACTKDFGVGFGSKLPWSISQELEIFKTKTWNNVVIMGRKTMVHLPHLSNRELLCISKSISSVKKSKCKTEKNQFYTFVDILSAFHYARFTHKNKKIFIAGGASIYNQILNDNIFKKYITKLHISIVKEKYDCTSFIKFPFLNWKTVAVKEYDDFTHYEMVYNENGEEQYHCLLENVYSDGNGRYGRNGLVISKFARNLTFNLQEGFPLLTGKKMFFRGIVEELLFFLKGETDTTILENKGVKIWHENTKKSFIESRKLEYKEGLLGPLYGYQWRFFNQPYNNFTGEPMKKEGDQLKYVINLIKNDPASRRILMSTYNPLQAEEGVLYPCHSLMIQFYVTFTEISNKPYSLSMFCFNRSSDLFLGLPFNIASSALLLMIIAKCTGLKPEFLNISLGDAHVYEEHKNAVAEYLSRSPFFTFPQLNIKKELSCIEDIESL